MISSIAACADSLINLFTPRDKGQSIQNITPLDTGQSDHNILPPLGTGQSIQSIIPLGMGQSDQSFKYFTSLGKRQPFNHHLLRQEASLQLVTVCHMIVQLLPCNIVLTGHYHDIINITFNPLTTYLHEWLIKARMCATVDSLSAFFRPPPDPDSLWIRWLWKTLWLTVDCCVEYVTWVSSIASSGAGPGCGASSAVLFSDVFTL